MSDYSRWVQRGVRSALAGKLDDHARVFFTTMEKELGRPELGFDQVNALALQAGVHFDLNAVSHKRGRTCIAAKRELEARRSEATAHSQVKIALSEEIAEHSRGERDVERLGFG